MCLLNEETKKNRIKKKVSFFPYYFTLLTNSELELYNSNLKLFELKMNQWYSFGNDSFTVNSGKKYHAYFKRLGIVNYLLIHHDCSKLIIGTSCVILRRYPNNEFLFWYLTDLKIDKDHRNQNLTIKLFKSMFYKFSRISKSGFLVCMDPESQQLIHIFKDIKDQNHIKLLIYLIPVTLFKFHEQKFIGIFGKISYLSLYGEKDMIFKSSNRVMNIYHLQHGIFSAKDGIDEISNLSESSNIMFCIPKNSSFEKILDDLNIYASSTATIISWHMDFFDWNQLLTSNI